MKPPTTPSPRSGARRAAWVAGLVALALAVPMTAQLGSADATSDRAEATLVAANKAARKNADCTPPIPGWTPPVAPPPTPTPTPTPAPTPTPTNGTTPTPPTTPPTTPPAPPAQSWPITSIRIIQANIKAGSPQRKFESDLATVFASSPDFISYNEVPYRLDTQLAPPGYALQRTPGQYTGASPVAWNTNRWLAINQGTTMISNKLGIMPGQRVHWGVRYANWVTVRSLDGCQTVSMVATHLAPKNKFTAKLMPSSIRRLGKLVSALSAAGPVFVGGDFNRHYKSAEYPRAGLTAAGLASTYDMAGWYFPTGDYRGATIDYIMVRPPTAFTVLEQSATELYSDHDMVSAVLSMPARTVGEAPVSFAPGTSVNNPASSASASKRAIVRTVRSAVTNTTAGASVRVSTARLGDRVLGRLLRKAAARGVEVRVVSGSATPTKAEQALVEVLGASRRGDTWIQFRPHRFATRPLAPTMLIADRSGATQNLVLTSNRALDGTMTREVASARIVTTRATYAAQVKAFSKLARGPQR